MDQHQLIQEMSIEQYRLGRAYTLRRDFTHNTFTFGRDHRRSGLRFAFKNTILWKHRELIEMGIERHIIRMLSEHG